MTVIDIPSHKQGDEHRDHHHSTHLGVSLTHDFDASVSAANWITPADQAAVTAARSIAATIDSTLSSEDADRGEKTKVLYLIPHFQKLLTELKLTPMSRGDIEKASESEDPAERFMRERVNAAAAAGRR